MAPVPFRGKPCHSGMIPFIVKEISKIKNVEEKIVYEQTMKNAEMMFGL